LVKWWHIVLVGTSCLRNIAQVLGDNELMEFAVKPGIKPSSRIISSIDKYFEILSSNPYRISAELNGMRDYLDGGLVHGVTLVYTDTDSGHYAAKLLEKYFELKNIPVRSCRVKYLGKVFELGVLNLLDTLVVEVNRVRSEGFRIAINLTGGFKAETGYALLVASLLGIDKAYYVYEVGYASVELPLIPLTPKQEYLKAIQLIEEKEYTYKEIYELMASHGLGIKIIDELRDKGFLEEINGALKPRKWITLYKKIV